MLGAVCFLLYFVSIIFGALANNVYLHDVYNEYPTCWQSDNDMLKLGKKARYAFTILLGIEAMGLIGAGT
jgi:hypothetical protein